MTDGDGRPLVSCIIPAHNAERYLAEALDSIMAQTYEPIETIVVDDASTDGTGGVAARYGDRITVVPAEANLGPGRSRNLGVARSSGQLFAFLDADDYWHPQKIEAQVEALRRDPSAGYSITLIEHFCMPGITIDATHPLHGRFAKPMVGYSLCCVLVPREIFVRVGHFRAGAAEDTDWFMRLHRADIQVAIVDRVMTFRRIHESNYSRDPDFQGREGILTALKSTLDQRRQDS